MLGEGYFEISKMTAETGVVAKSGPRRGFYWTRTAAAPGRLVVLPKTVILPNMVIPLKRRYHVGYGAIYRYHRTGASLFAAIPA